MEECVLRRIACGHVVKWNPVLLSALIYFQIIAHRNLETVDLLVVCDCCRTEVLSLCQRGIHKQIVFCIWLVGRRTRLYLELLIESMDFVERNRVPLRDQSSHRLGFCLGLISIVSVQVKIVRIGTGEVGSSVNVF